MDEPKALSVLFFVVCAFALIVFVSVETVIIKHGNSFPKSNAAYMIVLGS